MQELRDAPSPLQSYLNLYAPHVDGFARALERETPTSLGMNELAYNDMSDYLGKLKNGMDMLVGDDKRSASKQVDGAFAPESGPINPPMPAQKSSTQLFAQM